MGFLRYDDDELNARLARAVELRWPEERLLMVVPCAAERDHPAGDAGDGPEDRGPEPGALAVTDRRVVFAQRARGAPVMRVGAALFLVMAGLGLLSGKLWPPLVVAAIGAGLWVAARVAEDASLDHGHSPLSELDVDLERQELRPISRWSRVRRLLVPDPTQFGAILRLIYLPPATPLGA